MKQYKVLKEFIDPDFKHLKPDEIFAPKSKIMVGELVSAGFIEEIRQPSSQSPKTTLRISTSGRLSANEWDAQTAIEDARTAVLEDDASWLKEGK